MSIKIYRETINSYQATEKWNPGTVPCSTFQKIWWRKWNSGTVPGFHFSGLPEEETFGGGEKTEAVQQGFGRIVNGHAGIIPIQGDQRILPREEDTQVFLRVEDSGSQNIRSGIADKLLRIGGADLEILITVQLQEDIRETAAQSG